MSNPVGICETEAGVPGRFAAIHVPQFALQAALRHEPEVWGRPVALVEGGTTAPRVIEATRSARAAGVVDGMTAPQALARCREVSIRARVPAAEEAAGETLLQGAYAFSPHLEATAPGWVMLDLRGLPDWNGPGPVPEAARAAWGRRLIEALAALGWRVRVGIGPTPNVARHAARWGGEPSTAGVGWHPDSMLLESGVNENPDPGDDREPGFGDSRFAIHDSPRFMERRAGDGAPVPGVATVRDPAAMVGSLPIAALEPSSDAADRLGRWGLATVGELLALGATDLADRLGLEALALLAAASVTATRPLKLAAPAERFGEERTFEAEIETLEPLLFVLRRFLEGLGRRLEACGQVAGVLILRLDLASGERIERRLEVPQPTCRVEVLFRMLHTHLEGVRTESPVRAVGLRAEPARPEQRQFGLFEVAVRDPHRFQETLARLAALVGADRVGSPRREDSHRTDAVTMVPPDFDGEWAGLEEPVPEVLRPVPIRRWRPARPFAGERPAWRTAAGPWRASGRWWDAEAWDRETWDAGDEQGRVLRWVCEAGGWRIEGELD